MCWPDRSAAGVVSSCFWVVVAAVCAATGLSWLDVSDVGEALASDAPNSAGEHAITAASTTRKRARFMAVLRYRGLGGVARRSVCRASTPLTPGLIGWEPDPPGPGGCCYRAARASLASGWPTHDGSRRLNLGNTPQSFLASIRASFMA